MRPISFRELQVDFSGEMTFSLKFEESLRLERLKAGGRTFQEVEKVCVPYVETAWSVGDLEEGHEARE